MLMPPPELPGFRGSNGVSAAAGAGHLPPAAQAPLQHFGLSGAMADPAGAAAAAAAAWGTSGAPGGGGANPGGRSLIDNYLPPASSAAISAYAAQMRGGGGAPGGPFSPSRSAGGSQPALPFGIPQVRLELQSTCHPAYALNSIVCGVVVLTLTRCSRE
jgi:hypothetical protein